MKTLLIILGCLVIGVGSLLLVHRQRQHQARMEVFHQEQIAILHAQLAAINSLIIQNQQIAMRKEVAP